MKKNIIVILVVLVLAVAAFFLINKDKTNSTLLVNEAASSNEEKSGPFMGTLKEAMALGVAMKCENSVETEEGDGTVSGIIQGKEYIGQISANGKTQNVILKDNCMWSWEEGANNGITMCFEAVEEGSIEDTQDLFSADFDQMDANVRCMPTVVTPGMFNPPANVNFLNMDNMDFGNLTEEQMRQMEDLAE